MSTETRRAPAAPIPELDAEQEVDFGRYWRQIKARWWLPVVGLVAGAIIGYAVSVGTRRRSYHAPAQVYLGAPTAPESANLVTSSPTTLGLVTNFLTSDATTRSVAGRV